MSQPPDRIDTPNLFDPFGLWKQSQETMKQSQETMLESWSKSMTDAVNTSAYADSTGRMLDTYLTVSAPLRKIMEQTMTQVLSQLSLPSRAEVISLAERMTNIEMRLDDLDAQLDDIMRTVERTASAVTTLHEATMTSIMNMANTTNAMLTSASEQTNAQNDMPAQKQTAAASRRTTKSSTTTTAQAAKTPQATKAARPPRSDAAARSRSKTK